EDHRPRDEARSLRRVRAHLFHDLTLRLGAAAPARAVRRRRRGGARDPWNREPVAPRTAARWPRPAGVLEPRPWEYHRSGLDQLEPRDAPHEHRRGRGGDEAPAA